MTISYNWLKQFINLPWDAEKTGELLTDLGLEVEGIEADGQSAVLVLARRDTDTAGGRVDEPFVDQVNQDGKGQRDIVETQPVVHRVEEVGPGNAL